MSEEILNINLMKIHVDQIYQKLWHAVNAVVRKKFIELNVYIKKKSKI